MNKLSEKQRLIVTIACAMVVVLGFGALTYWDLDRIYAAEVTDENPEAAEIADPEQWGELRHIQEIEKQIATARAEAEKIPQREQDVIVYREIVARDAAILPSEDEVNQLTRTIGDFERMAGVTLTRVSELDTSVAKGQAIAHIPIKLQFSGTFEETLKFVNLFENLDRIVNVSAFNISGGRSKDKDADGIPRHEIALDLMTYMYTSSAGLAKPVEISNYEGRKNDPVIQKLIRQKKAAFVEKYQLQSRVNRRDPLVDPRRRVDELPEGLDPEDADAQKRLVNKLKFDVELLKEDVRQERFYARNKKYVPLAEIKKVIDEKFGQLELDIRQAEPRVSIPELQEVLHDDVVAPFSELKAERDMTDRPQLVPAASVREFLDRMNQALDAFDYAGAVQQHKTFEAFVADLDIAEDAAPLVAEMQALRREAEVSLEFERLKLVYSGTILQPNSSVVIVNGKALRVGGYVDAEGRCRIVEITEDHILYDFDGFQIQDPLVKK